MDSIAGSPITSTTVTPHQQHSAVDVTKQVLLDDGDADDSIKSDAIAAEKPILNVKQNNVTVNDDIINDIIDNEVTNNDVINDQEINNVVIKNDVINNDVMDNDSTENHAITKKEIDNVIIPDKVLDDDDVTSDSSDDEIHQIATHNKVLEHDIINDDDVIHDKVTLDRQSNDDVISDAIDDVISDAIDDVIHDKATIDRQSKDDASYDTVSVDKQAGNDVITNTKDDVINYDDAINDDIINDEIINNDVIKDDVIDNNLIHAQVSEDDVISNTNDDIINDDDAINDDVIDNNHVIHAKESEDDLISNTNDVEESGNDVLETEESKLTTAVTDVDRLYSQCERLHTEGAGEQALPGLLACMKRATDGERFKSLSQCLRMIADIYYKREEFEKAVQFIQAEKMLYETNLMKLSSDKKENSNYEDNLIEEFKKLSNLCLDSDELGLAMEYQGKATNLCVDKYGYNHHMTSDNLNLFTEIYAKVGKQSYQDSAKLTKKKVKQNPLNSTEIRSRKLNSKGQMVTFANSDLNEVHYFDSFTHDRTVSGWFAVLASFLLIGCCVLLVYLHYMRYDLHSLRVHLKNVNTYATALFYKLTSRASSYWR